MTTEALDVRLPARGLLDTAARAIRVDRRLAQRLHVGLLGRRIGVHGLLRPRTARSDEENEDTVQAHRREP
jgi:hypothetical protein